MPKKKLARIFLVVFGDSLSPIPRNEQKVAQKGATFPHFHLFINK